jgi:catechol 2,3-dioxygenase-like lactoylglutathione lyase family enzyme
MRVNHLDHLVLTVKDIEASVLFYTRVLGMRETTFGGGRKALVFGSSKINLHQVGHEFEPKAALPTPGSADICLIVDDDLDSVQAQLAAAGVPVEVGPVEQTGAVGEMMSVYIRDPDQNLVELSNYLS